LPIVDEPVGEIVTCSSPESRGARSEEGPVTTTLADVDLADLDTFVAGVPHDMFDLLRREAPVSRSATASGASSATTTSSS